VLRFSDSRNFSRTLAGLSLIVAPLVLIAAVLIGPDLDEDAATRLGEIADDKALYVTSGILFFVGAYLFVPGILGLIRLLRGRGITFGQVAAGIFLVGVIAVVGFYPVGGAEYVAATGEGLDRGEMAAFVDEFDDSSIGIPFFITFLAGVFIGNILVAIALWRRGAVAVWAAIALVLSSVVGFFGEDKWISFVSFVFLAVGYGAVGLKILSISDERWASWEPLGPEEPAAVEPTPGPPGAARA
jgi:hypothetical protein